MKTIAQLLLALATLAMTVPAIGQLRLPNYSDNHGGYGQPPMDSNPGPIRLPNYDSLQDRHDRTPTDKPNGQRDKYGNSPTYQHGQSGDSYGESPAAGAHSNTGNPSIQNKP
ncbi:hypothetical protein [Paralcaligenes ginsengisoli]